MAESARFAISADIASCVQIAERHAETLEGKRGADLLMRTEQGRGPLSERLQQALNSDVGLVVVGLFDSVVVGYGLAAIVTLYDGTKLGHLEHFVVDPEFREVAVGEAIMNLAVEELAAAGCFGVDSQALPGDRETKNFFESFGQKARMLTVHRQFD